ncbi:hypothetical protein GWI33_007200 [Rhynchophorus ferrugineus]|uniref:Uncharacterized protein n=1 Tax=Rhynchophorus ferrugineus TaxID=354439 RepID=A0A834II62_RHYFE|nr:hypothetical protein GWI33_007200 [Rhynchophorus ferrugineus]
MISNIINIPLSQRRPNYDAIIQACTVIKHVLSEIELSANLHVLADDTITQLRSATSVNFLIMSTEYHLMEAFVLATQRNGGLYFRFLLHERHYLPTIDSDVVLPRLNSGGGGWRTGRAGNTGNNILHGSRLYFTPVLVYS